MDEAERCHRLAYISYGTLLAAGTAAEIVARPTAAHLGDQRTRDSMADATAVLGRDPAWMVVPFGSAVHVSAPRGADLPAWLACTRRRRRGRSRRSPPGWKTSFIALTAHAQDNFQ
jgi:ABC-2 type transport system ATP-binding protein